MIKHVNENEFNQEIKNKRVLVDFYATWCGPCKMLALVMEKFDKKNIIPILKLDVDDANEIANEYKVTSIPTLIIFEEGQEIKRTTGFLTLEELERWVNDEEK